MTAAVQIAPCMVDVPNTFNTFHTRVDGRINVVLHPSG
jgi:hypothetical protein